MVLGRKSKKTLLSERAEADRLAAEKEELEAEKARAQKELEEALAIKENVTLVFHIFQAFLSYKLCSYKKSMYSADMATPTSTLWYLASSISWTHHIRE